MVAALWAALFTRLDLLCEILAVRHQQGVLARSDRRFRPADRLLWLCLQRFWPRRRDALVLVQPATVDRWRRAGFWGCWRRRSPRRPGRPRIDSRADCAHPIAVHFRRASCARKRPFWLAGFTGPCLPDYAHRFQLRQGLANPVEAFATRGQRGVRATPSSTILTGRQVYAS